jgi:hypothetical protein
VRRFEGLIAAKEATEKLKALSKALVSKEKD